MCSCPLLPTASMVFFFQAEDGIRDGHVTGVQTCALPISRHRHGAEGTTTRRTRAIRRGGPARSEERRVGEECRSRWPLYHKKKKMKRRLSDKLPRPWLGRLDSSWRQRGM